MSAAEALKAAFAAGIRFGVDGDELVLEASTPPPLAVLDLLSRHKVGIVTLLRLSDDGWAAEDWHVFFDERASPSSTADCRAAKPRPTPSPAARRSG